MNTAITKPFSGAFLSQFMWAPQTAPFTHEEVLSFDGDLLLYEQVSLDPDIEKNLISKNELLASFAISKAENSQLTLREAQDVYRLLISDPDYNFVGRKLKAKKKLTQKDHDQLEFFNVVKLFRVINQKPFSVKELTKESIRELHQELTRGLDIFKNDLSGFTVYKAGKFRDNDCIRVGSYIPAPHTEIEEGIEELISYIQKNKTAAGIAIFHVALYGLHPFNNGNKRVCRILEHVLLRSVGINEKNLYSTSYYYHKQKERYYKYLLYSLERKNLNHFVSFMLEALVLSIINVVKTALETKRSEFLGKQEVGGQEKLVLKPFIKRGEIQFKNLAKLTQKKITRPTLVTYLQRVVELHVLTRRESGRNTYYALNFESPEEKTLKQWLVLAKQKLSYIPDDIQKAIKS